MTVTLLEIAQKDTKIFGQLFETICYQEFAKIAQSRHTGRGKGWTMLFPSLFCCECNSHLKLNLLSDSFLFLKNGTFPAPFSFLFFFSINLIVNFNINFANGWIQTGDLWNRKRPLYQLIQNHCLVQVFFDKNKSVTNRSEIIKSTNLWVELILYSEMIGFWK